MGVGRTPNVLYNGVQGSTGGSTPNVLYNGVQSTHLQPEVFIDEDVIVRGMRTSAAYFIDCGRVRVTLAGAPSSSAPTTLPSTRSSSTRSTPTRRAR